MPEATTYLFAIIDVNLEKKEEVQKHFNNYNNLNNGAWNIIKFQMTDIRQYLVFRFKKNNDAGLEAVKQLIYSTKDIKVVVDLHEMDTDLGEFCFEYIKEQNDGEKRGYFGK